MEVMPLHETMGPLAGNEWLSVMFPFQLASRGLVRGCLVVPFPQLKATWPMSDALVDIQRGALCLGKGLKNSPLIHYGRNVMQQHPTLKRKLILA